jgi:hypothetical protein
LRAWQAIVLGFGVETAALFFMCGVPFARALLASGAMNAASTLIGAIAIPVLGLGWEFIIGVPMGYLLNWGTFNPVTWVATFFLATAVNTVIELIVVATLFSVPWTKRTISVFFAANALSVGLAFYVLATTPLE